jgi:predicted nucleotidyltransferase
LIDVFLENDKKRLNYLKNYTEVAKSVKKICLRHDRNSRVILFGSVLRGNWTGNSDIDLLIILKSPGAKDKITIDIWRTVEAPVEIHFATEDEFKNWYLRFIDVYREI